MTSIPPDLEDAGAGENDVQERQLIVPAFKKYIVV